MCCLFKSLHSIRPVGRRIIVWSVTQCSLRKIISIFRHIDCDVHVRHTSSHLFISCNRPKSTSDRLRASVDLASIALDGWPTSTAVRPSQQRRGMRRNGEQIWQTDRQNLTMTAISVAMFRWQARARPSMEHVRVRRHATGALSLIASGWCSWRVDGTSGQNRRRICCRTSWRFGCRFVVTVSNFQLARRRSINTTCC